MALFIEGSIMSDKNLPEELTPVDDLHAAFVLDEEGNEVAITQDMIDQAADKLEQDSNTAKS